MSDHEVREGEGATVTLRYARYAGIAMLCATVATWVAVSRRPRIHDDQVRAARAYISSARPAELEACERPVLRGLPQHEEGTEALGVLAQWAPPPECQMTRMSPGCSVADEVRQAAMSARVCNPIPLGHRRVNPQWPRWLASEARTMALAGQTREALELLLDGLRAVDDTRRGWPHPDLMAQHLVGSEALMLVFESILGSAAELSPTDLDELLAQVQVLVSTSPGSMTATRGALVQDISQPRFQRRPMRATRRSPWPRAMLVALHRLALDADAHCTSDEACAQMLARVVRQVVDEPPAWQVLVFGKRARAEWTMQQSIEELARWHLDLSERIREFRRSERALAIHLRFRAVRDECPAANELGVALAGTSTPRGVVIAAGDGEFRLEGEREFTLWDGDVEVGRLGCTPVPIVDLN